MGNGSTVNTFSGMSANFKETYPKKVVSSAISTQKKKRKRFDKLANYLKGK